MAAGVADDDELASIGKYAAIRLASQVNVVTTSLVSRSQSFTVLSFDAETARRPSGVTATPHIVLPWPVRVHSSRPLSTSHTFSVLSSEAETARCPSGVTATAVSFSAWPVRVRSSRPLSTSHTLSVSGHPRPRPPVARRASPPPP